MQGESIEANQWPRKEKKLIVEIGAFHAAQFANTWFVELQRQSIVEGKAHAYCTYVEL